MAYLLLFCAILLELSGTTFLKMSYGFTKAWPTICCLSSYILCFFLFSKAAVHLNLALAYATWSGVGIIASVFISWFFFGEKLNAIGLISIALIVTGCVLLNLFGAEK